MVSRRRARQGTPGLRPLNTPIPVRVAVDSEGRPLAVQRAHWSNSRPVVRVLETWRIDDEWWRERPISRLYFRLLLTGDLLATVFHDLTADQWYAQRELPTASRRR